MTSIELGGHPPDIGSHGLIGDMSSAALVATDGTIDWLCMPRFDSPSVFAALLDSKSGGRFQIAPVGPAFSSQEYLPDTNILRTAFKTETGVLTVTDFMPVRGGALSEDAPHEVHRVVRCESGEVDVSCVFEPRLDYARGPTALSPLREGVQARGGRQTLSMLASVPLRIDARRGGAVARFALRQGESASFVLAYGHGRPVRVGTYRTDARLEETRRFWQEIVAGIRYDGPGIGRVRSGQQPGAPVRNLGNGDREFRHGSAVRPAIVHRRSQWASATGTTDSRD